MSESTVVGGRYRLDERIAAGAMGAVWRGTDQLLNRTVAIKELLAASAPSSVAEGREALEESRQRIHREGRIAARLQHAHVIRMFDVVVHEDRPWLVMEYLESKSLSAVINETGTLSPLEAAAIGRDVADGLSAAHAAGVVHRDVKPGNVLIGEDGRTKLTDFGVSRAIDDVQITRTGLIAGTPAFLAPEVARGADPAPAADVFALGATIYAAVEGTPPFGLNDNAYALLHKVATGVINPPKRTGPLTGLVLRLLAKDPDERPTAAEARDELAAVARTGAATEPPADPTPAPAKAAERVGPATLTALAPVPPPRPPRSRRTPILLGALALLVAGGGVAAVTVLPTADATNTPVAAAPSDGLPPVPSPAPRSRTTAPPTAPPDSAGALATAAAAPETAPETSAAPVAITPAQGASTGAVAFVQNYYSLLPDNTGAAFAMLSPNAQAASGGRRTYDDFYGSLRSVSVQNLRAEGSTVTATVVFVRADGTSSAEPYRFVTGTSDSGDTIMESFSRS